METERIKKVFPAYFENFILPDCAKEQEILVYRACPTRKIEKASFLNTYEENGFRIEVGSDEDDPQQYCLSTNTRAKDLKRFVALNGKFSPPFLLAKGVTNPECGVSCQSSEWLHKKTNHVDWWLYTDAEPWKYFEAVDYENEK